MGKRTSPDADDWHGVQDAKKRKQIQDRLAQRARRERMAKQAPTKSTPIHKGKDVKATQATSDGKATQNQEPIVTRYLVPSAADNSRSPSSTSLVTISQSQNLRQMENHTLYSALFHNGLILGLPCSSAAASKSALAGPKVPMSLRPIPLQLEQVHFEWIDRLPIPEFRHNMIRFSDIMNTEDFMADIYMTQTFNIQPGRDSWDPEAWEATPEFKAKWSYLFLPVEEQETLC